MLIEIKSWYKYLLFFFFTGAIFLEISCKKNHTVKQGILNPAQVKIKLDKNLTQPTFVEEVKNQSAILPIEKLSIEKRWLQELGGKDTANVAVLPSAQGIFITSIDRKKTIKIVEGKVDWLLVDHLAKVIWYRLENEKGIWILDLLASEVISKHLLTSLQIEEFGIIYPEFKKDGKSIKQKIIHTNNYYLGNSFDLEMDLGQIKLKKNKDLYFLIIEEKKQRSTFLKLSEQDSHTLAFYAQRAFNNRQVENSTESTLQKGQLKFIKWGKNCDDSELCGTTEQIPGQPYLRVLTEHSCGDMCYTSYQAYDPRTSQFFDLLSSQKSKNPLKKFVDLQNIWISLDGFAFIKDGNIFFWNPVEKNIGLTYKQSGPRGGGWLKGQHYLE